MAEELRVCFRSELAGKFEVLVDNVSLGTLVLSDRLNTQLFSIPTSIDNMRELTNMLFCSIPELAEILGQVKPSERIVFEFQEGAMGLPSLPWEYVKLPHATVPLSLENPFARRLGKGAALKPIESHPLRALVIIAEPLPLPQFEGHAFHDAIVRQAQKHASGGALQLEFVGLPCTPDAVSRKLLENDFDVVLFIGHGDVEDSGVLYFEDEAGDTVKVEAEKMYSVFKGKTTRLVVLVACYSGSVAGEDPLSGIATGLVKAGIPSVIAMQLPLEVKTALELIQDFFAGLFRMPLDQLVLRLRQSRFFAENCRVPAQWGVPVLYLQDPSRNPLRGVGKGQGWIKGWKPAQEYFLPERPEVFVGRKNLMVSVNKALLGTKVVVLHGESGIGKSFVALELAHYHRLRGTFAGGIVWIDLQGGATYDSVLQTLALALFKEVTSEKDILNRLALKPTLLLLDSLDKADSREAGQILRLLRALPAVSKAIVTTIETIGFGSRITVRDLIPEEATTLFIRRARQAGWDGTDEELILPLCRELGNMPLAIVLIADQAASTPVRTLLAKVRASLDSIAAESLDLSPRHRSLQATFQFSYDSLGAEEKLVLTRMSVFPSDATASIISGVTEVPNAASTLAKLHDKSWVRFSNNRYWQHSLVRRFALEKLEQDFKARDLYEDKFALYYGSLASEGVRRLKTEAKEEVVAVTHAELVNLLAAQRYFLAKRQWDKCVGLSAALNLLFSTAGLCRASITACSAFVKAAEQKGDQELLAQGYLILGEAYENLSNFERAEEAYQRSLAISESLGDQHRIAFCLYGLASVEFNRGNWRESKKYYRESMRLYRAVGDNARVRRCLMALADLERSCGKLQAAERHFEECLEMAKGAGDEDRVGDCLHGLAIIATRHGEYDKARELFLKSLQLAKRRRSIGIVGVVLHDMAIMEEERGNLLEAEQLCLQLLEVRQRIGHMAGVGHTLQELGVISFRRGDLDTAERYCRQSLSVKEEVGDRRGMATSMALIADIENKKGNGQEAWEYCWRALDIFLDLGDEEAITGFLTLFADLSAEGYDDERALELYIRLRFCLKAPTERQRQLTEEGILRLSQKLGEETLQRVMERVKFQARRAKAFARKRKSS